MPIDFSAYERGAPFNGDGAAELVSLQGRIAALNLAQIVHGGRAMIIFEGWSGSGRRSALRKLNAALDPCHVGVTHFRREDVGQEQRHWFAPFWEVLPGSGDTQLALGSWYSRAVDLKFAGRAEDRLWTRMLDEINEFESQQRDHGTVLVKLFFHVSETIQRERLEARLADAWERHLVGTDELRRAEQRDLFKPVMSDLFESSNMRWAPWKIIDAADEEAAQIAALTTVADALAKAIPAEPPSDAGTAEVVDFQARRRG